MEEITPRMLEEHKKIDVILQDVIDAIPNMDDLVSAFNRLKWSIQKHFFVEEKAIFSLFEKIKGEEVAETFELMQQHGEILNKLTDIEDDLEKQDPAALEELQKQLKIHAEQEDTGFYPNLDKTLNDQQKQEIVDRAKEILRD